MQIWSPGRKERVMWSHFLGLADFEYKYSAKQDRGQRDKLSTDSLDPQHCWVCSPAIPKAQPGTAQCLLQRREHSSVEWRAVRTCRHQFCSSWPDQSLHTIQRTLRPQTPHFHFMHAPFHASNATLMGFYDNILNTMKGKKIYLSLIGGKAIHSVDRTLNLSLELLPDPLVLYSTPQHLIAIPGCLI